MDKHRTYTNSLYYEIRLTARYLKVLGNQMFEKLDYNVSFDEFIALDVINSNPEMCQRDLAKILLKDRANTGKIASKLEQKGLIEIIADTKNNKLIKKLILTEAGKKLSIDICNQIDRILNSAEINVSQEKEEQLVMSLQNVRKIADKLIEIQI